MPIRLLGACIGHKESPAKEILSEVKNFNFPLVRRTLSENRLLVILNGTHWKCEKNLVRNIASGAQKDSNHQSGAVSGVLL